MNNQYQVTATIVLYKNNIEELKRAIWSFLNTNLKVRIYLVDNSPIDELKSLASLDERVALYEYMQANPDVGNVLPKVIYPNGDLQYLCKLLPTPMDWIGRMFIPFKSIKKRINDNFEMRFSGYDKEMNAPYLSGCFMFLRKSVIEEVGVFDEGIFMYGEDTDLNRRIFQKYRTMYYPSATITHAFEKGSHKKIRLFWIHVKAAVYYLNKWGWFFDKERREINKKAKLAYTNMKLTNR